MWVIQQCDGQLESTEAVVAKYNGIISKISPKTTSDFNSFMWINLYKSGRLNMLHLPFVYGQNELRFACPYFV